MGIASTNSSFIPSILWRQVELDSEPELCATLQAERFEPARAQIPSRFDCQTVPSKHYIRVQICKGARHGQSPGVASRTIP
ncbi:hypothetical protein CC2G_011389 [Coprinopsis cinerea AmutBmut pab1-1]|nr:hypothetical protein CC2G_011389 [Coprinopsis cinerea AmutBmut pab1-1]